MELDHIFLFTTPTSPDLPYLHTLGLTETYRRKHPGQGTENICFCFDNIFLECIWLTDAEEAQSPQIVRTRLYERSQWHTLGTSPFGLAWRDTATTPSTKIPTWPFRPPYLPPSITIDVAADSDDPNQPMLFKSPGSTPPASWPPEKRGALQHQAGLGQVLSATLHWPNHAPPTPSLKTLAAHTILNLAPSNNETTSLILVVQRHNAATPLEIRLPHTHSSLSKKN